MELTCLKIMLPSENQKPGQDLTNFLLPVNKSWDFYKSRYFPSLSKAAKAALTPGVSSL